MKFQKQNGRAIKFNGIDGVAYTSAKDCSAVDIAVVKVNGRHGKTKTTVSDRIYFVIDGEGKFTINDQDIPVVKDDVILIPKGTPYDFEGSMRVAIFCSPAFDPAAEIDLESE